jgi:hypothetical protein
MLYLLSTHNNNPSTLTTITTCLHLFSHFFQSKFVRIFHFVVVNMHVKIRIIIIKHDLSRTAFNYISAQTLQILLVKKIFPAAEWSIIFVSNQY